MRRVTAGVEQASLAQALQAELANPDNVTIEPPLGSNPLTLASGADKLAHPLGRLAVRQRAVPFDLRVERLGTRPLAGGPQAVSVATVALNGAPMGDVERTTEQFSRGQFVELTEDEKLTGPTFESFTSGVVVGSAGYTAADGFARDVTAGFETVRLDPEPKGIISRWNVSRLDFVRATSEDTARATRLGAAARSARAEAIGSHVTTVGAVAVDEPPLALVATDALAQSATLVGAAASSPSLAAQVAATGGQRVVERFEVVT